MIVLDNNSLIAAFQLHPPASSAVHRERVRHFINDRGGRFAVPAIVLSEYLFKFEGMDRQREFAELLKRHVFVPSFDRVTAEIASDLGRRFAAGQSFASVARQNGSDRYCLKSDLMIIATAVQHQSTAFVTGDCAAHRIAIFAGLDSHLLANLPGPPSPIPSREQHPSSPRTHNLFDELSE